VDLLNSALAWACAFSKRHARTQLLVKRTNFLTVYAKRVGEAGYCESTEGTAVGRANE